ncbi:MAG: TonB family protein [Nitrospirae bacterium]|nr:TonB family protein [Nitrospirota bacterium]
MTMRRALIASVILHIALIALLRLLPESAPVQPDREPMRVRIVPPLPTAVSKIVPPVPVAKSAPPKVVIPQPEPEIPAITSKIPVIESKIPPGLPLQKEGDMPPAPIQPATPAPSATPSGENRGSPIPTAPSSIPSPGRWGQGGVLPGGNRAALFDPKVIEQYGAAKKEDAPITLDIEQLKQISREREINANIREIVHLWLDNIRKYNIEQELTGSYYDLYFHFEVMTDGSVGNIQLIRTSGIPMLDRAALEAMRDAAHFPPLPKQWNGKTLLVQGQFVIFNKNYYLR